jgi:hypothetical protein
VRLLDSSELFTITISDMPAYLVRLIKNRDIVGFFVAADEHEVMFAVDECTDIDACEYVELPDGGIMWESPAASIPLDTATRFDEESRDAPDLPWAAASLTERWWSFVHGYGDLDWLPFCPDATDEPAPKTPAADAGPRRVLPFARKKMIL